MAKKFSVVEPFYNHVDGFKTNQSQAEKNSQTSYQIGSLISPVYGEKSKTNNNYNPSQNERTNGHYAVHNKNSEDTTIVQTIIDNVVTKEINAIKPKNGPHNKKIAVNEIKSSILLKQKPPLPRNIFFPRNSKINEQSADYKNLNAELIKQQEKLGVKVEEDLRALKKYQQVKLFEDKEK